MQKSELIITEDGSHTLFVSEIDECYHSTKGAIQESRHIFIEAGLKQCEKSEINVLEIGFGTGLNALLTAHLTLPPNPLKGEIEVQKVNYSSIELYPIPLEQVLNLNYPETLEKQRNVPPGVFRSLFEKIHANA